MDLRHRIERLERENRNLKMAGVALLLVVGAAIAFQLGIGQPQPVYAQEKVNVIEAEKFVLRQGGKVRAELKLERDQVKLYLYAKEGDQKSVLSPERLILDDGNKDAHVSLIANAGSAILSLESREEKGRIHMTVSQDGGGPIINLKSQKKGSIAISVSSDEKQVAPSLRVYDQRDNVIGKLP